MYKICKTESSARRQREIENCLLELMSIKRYEDITITELSEKMNMPRKAFYRYFDSKDDALYALIDHTMAEYSGFTVDKSQEPNRSLRRELEEYFKFWISKQYLLNALDRSGLVGTLIERNISYPVKDVIMLEKFLPDEDRDISESIFKFAFSGLVYTMINWYRDGFATSTQDMAKVACRMLREPLFPNLSKLGIGE
ncbi:MAG: TetR/AcrR family transcriptional regulator [Clostridia bacterium]|nr:TetR/AcrR family transcriptional regulator [Clostridia bacterium]